MRVKAVRPDPSGGPRNECRRILRATAQYDPHVIQDESHDPVNCWTWQVIYFTPDAARLVRFRVPGKQFLR
jgi:hypothetical protein